MASGRQPLPEDVSAQTLNYALGNLGGRQKSWMVLPSNAPALPPYIPAERTANPPPLTVRGRGRPRKQAAAVPSTTLASRAVESLNPRPTVETEPQPLSNSTSPQLPNVVVADQTSPHYAQSVAHVFPSPTPSEETWRCPPAAPYEGLPSKRPSEGNLQDPEKRRRSEAYEQGRPAPVPNTANPHPDLPRRPSAHYSQFGSPVLDQANNYNRSPAMMASLQMPQGIQLQDPRVSRTPPQPYGLHGPPQAFTQAPNPQPLSRSAQGDNMSSAPSVQPSSDDVWYTKKYCLQMLHSFQASHPLSSNNPQDGRRLRVLEDAVKIMDWAYLTMHQYYCLLTHFPHLLPEDVQALPGLQQAQKMLSEVLDSNHILSPAYLHFFSNFPYPMQQIAAMWPAKFEHQAHLFRLFVVQSQNYHQLKEICEGRRCPPLARDLASDLRIASPTFQRLVFTAFLRCMWRAVPPNPLFTSFEAQAVALFRKNQVDYQQRHSHPVAETFEYHQQEKAYEDGFWGSKLKALVEGFAAALRKQGVSLAEHHYGAPQPQQQVHVSQPQQVQAHQIQPRQVQNSLPPVETTREMPPRPTRSVDPHSARVTIQHSRGRGCLPGRTAQSTAVSLAQRGGPLLPAPGWQQPQQRVPNPARFGLHQAHLQSPALRAQSKSSSLYTFFKGFLKSPTRLSAPGRAIEKWTFTLTSFDMQRIGKTVRDTTGGSSFVHITEETKFARLRCVKWPASEPTESLWAVADTSWIPHSYYTFNGTPLEPRKKIHYGKDLPIDLTGLLKEGENVLEIAVMARSGDTSHLNYMIAIEAMVVSSHDSIKQHCLQQSRVPADKVLQGIKSKLAAHDDDEITVVESTLTLGMFDPFSQARMCDIPVRSKACPHNDCFDLETFLNTRPRKGDASVADQWKCPICKSDARPHMLLVDGFMEDVKKQLVSRGLARTRHILVRQDGSWQPKAEVREGVSDDPPTPVTRRSVPADVEIIDLSD